MVALQFAEKNREMPEQYFNYDNLEISWSSPERYEIVRKLGRGKYSDVFEAVDTSIGSSVVIKVLKPVRKKKIKREVKILQNLIGGPNIVRLLDTVQDPASHTLSLVFEHVRNVDFRTFYPTLNDLQLKRYVYELLRSLHYSHSMGIMHRDVKPQNIMIDPTSNTIRLIDWGLAEFYHPGTEYNVRVASRYFKGPELLVNHMKYDYRLDMWSVGCVLAAILFRKEPFFRGKDNVDQLVQIAAVLGTSDLQRYLDRYDLKLDSKVVKLIGLRRKKPWKSFVSPETECLCTPEAIDLLDHLLRYDMCERFQSFEAMNHPYFYPVRH